MPPVAVVVGPVEIGHTARQIGTSCVGLRCVPASRVENESAVVQPAHLTVRIQDHGGLRRRRRQLPGRAPAVALVRGTRDPHAQIRYRALAGPACSIVTTVEAVGEDQITVAGHAQGGVPAIQVVRHIAPGHQRRLRPRAAAVARDGKAQLAATADVRCPGPCDRDQITILELDEYREQTSCR